MIQLTPAWQVSTNKVDDALRLVEKGANVHFVNKDEVLTLFWLNTLFNASNAVWFCWCPGSQIAALHWRQRRDTSTWCASSATSNEMLAQLRACFAYFMLYFLQHRANAHVHSQGGRAFECAVKQNHERVVKVGKWRSISISVVYTHLCDRLWWKGAICVNMSAERCSPLWERRDNNPIWYKNISCFRGPMTWIFRLILSAHGQDPPYLQPWGCFHALQTN